MRGLYAAPAAGFVQVHPVRDLGLDRAAALHLVGVRADALAASRIVGWVALCEGSALPPVVVLRASSRAEARIAALPLVADGPVVLCEGVARGRVALYERRERLLALAPDEAVREPRLALVAPGTGVLVAKALDPRNARDLRVLASQLANQLTPLDFQAAKVALEQALQRLDVDWRKLTPAAAKKLWATADRTMKAVLKTAHGEMLPSYVQRITVSLEDVAKATKEALHRQFLPRIGTSLEQRDVAAVRRIAEQQGWWVRDEWGVRSDRLTRDGQRIVRRGLAQGLGRDEIGRDLRRALPDMWQKYGQSYARLNAGMATSRARSFSEVASYQAAGIASYEIVAVIDERTTDICRALDGQIISTNRAAALLQQQTRLSRPEDIRDVAPLCREVERDGKRYVETAHGAEIAEVQRSGYGVRDDRGTNSYSRMGDQLADASVGMPPYHFNCRTLTVPRVDAPQFAVGQVPVAAPVAPPNPTPVAPAAGAGAIPLRPVDVLAAPRPGFPVMHGTASLLDQALLPEAFGGVGVSADVWAHKGAYGVRRWAGTPGEVGLTPAYTGVVDAFGASSEVLAKNLVDLVRKPGLLPEGNAAALIDLYQDAKVGLEGIPWHEQNILSAASVVAREDLGARELLLRVKEPNLSEEVFVRANGALIPADVRKRYVETLERYEAAVGQYGQGSAVVRPLAEDLRQRALDLVVAVEKSGAGKYAFRLDEVAASRFERVSAWTPEAEPIRRLKPYKQKPPKATAGPQAPVPVPPPSDVPALRPGRAAGNRPVTPDLWNVRPALEQSNRAEWYGRGGYFSTAAANPKTGEAVGRSAWREVPERALPGHYGRRVPDFEKLPLHATDHVVNVEVGAIKLPVRADGNVVVADVWANIVRGELKRGYKGVREYVLRDARGVSHFARYDGAAWEDRYFKDPDLVNRMFSGLASGSKVRIYDSQGNSKLLGGKALRKHLEKGGNLWTSDVRTFYKKAEVDWSQPGLIAGVPVEEQAARRIEQIRGELRSKIDDAIQRAKRARQAPDDPFLPMLTQTEEAQIVAPILRAELRATAGEAPVARAAQWDAEQGASATYAQRQAAGARSVSYASERDYAVLLKRSVAEHAMEDALHFASDRLRAQVQRRWAPRFVNVQRSKRAYQRGVDTFGEDGRIGGIAMDLQRIERFYPRTGSAPAGFRVDKAKLSDVEQKDWATVHHEIQHWVDDFGVHREVMARVRRDSLTDGAPVINITVNPEGRKVKEVYLPGRVLDRYDLRVYQAELEALERANLATGKWHTAAEYQRALDKVLKDEVGPGEMFSMTAQRFSGDDRELYRAWEVNPDQVSAYISVMRGHYVP